MTARFNVEWKQEHRLVIRKISISISKITKRLKLRIVMIQCKIVIVVMIYLLQKQQLGKPVYRGRS